MSYPLHSMKKWEYTCSHRSTSAISNVYNEVEGHCLQAIKIVHHHANGHFDWLISEHQSVNPSIKAISLPSGKYERLAFVYPVDEITGQQ